MPEYVCNECGAVFQTRLALQRHKEIFHMPQDLVGGAVQGDAAGARPAQIAPVLFKCGFCGATFSRHDDLREHLGQHAAEREERARERESRLRELGVRERRARGRAERVRTHGATATVVTDVVDDDPVSEAIADEGHEEVA